MPKSEPRYLTIYNQLKSQITSGTLTDNEQLPTELQLAKAYNVSRITSKRALTELESQGLIYRKQGSGSFVQPTDQPKTNKQLLLVLPFPTDAGLGDYASGVSLAASEHHYQAVTMDSASFFNLSAKEIHENYDGVIYLPQDLYQEAERIYQLKLAQVPVVILDKTLPALELPVVTADNFSGGQIATDHLLQLGHQQILFYAQRNNTVLPSSVYERYFGYLTALNQQHVTPVTALADLPTLNQFSTNDWLTYLADHQITAIVVENDLTAIKLMNTLRKVDPKIWQRLSIVGFDNIQAASLTYPSLTTVAQDFKGMGTKAVSLLLKTPVQPTTVRLPVQLIQRDSTQPFQPISKEK